MATYHENGKGAFTGASPGETLRTFFDRFWNRTLTAFKDAVQRTAGGHAMTTQTDTSVTTSIVVNAPIDRAFSVFTDDMGSWWPPEHHLVQGGLKEMVFEPRVGGNIYDVAVDGSECRWANVLVYEPPHRLVFSWNITTQWQLETDPARTSEVEVRFTVEDPTRTRVELEHRHIDRHGEGWQGMRDAVGSPDGWGIGLRRFAERLSPTV